MAITATGCLPVCYAGAAAAAAPLENEKSGQNNTVIHDQPVGTTTQPQR